MRKVLVLVLVLSLGGCANLTNAFNTLTSAQVTAQEVYIARNAFDILETTAAKYISYCKTNPSTPGCSKDAIAKLIPAVYSARIARNNLTQFQKANPGQFGTTGLYNALIAATTTLQQIEATYNVGGVVQ